MSDQINLFDSNIDDVKKELEKLRKEIEYHNKLYYEQDSPEYQIMSMIN